MSSLVLLALICIFGFVAVMVLMFIVMMISGHGQGVADARQNWISSGSDRLEKDDKNTTQ